jgi:PAS domain S-box-containing protein
MVERPIWNILLIDDEEDIRDVMSVTLEDAGYRVTTAPDGRTGLERCEAVQPQILITDIRMPGMDGLQVLEAVKDRFPEIEVIVATAYGEMDLAIRALQLDASDFITKPINDTALQLALNRARDRYRSRKQIADYTALLEQENAETSQQLRKTIEFQRNLIENSMDGILACDHEGRIVIFNRSMEALSGFSRTDVLNRMSLEEILGAEQAQRLKTELAGERYGGKDRLTLFETTLLGKSGRKVPVQISAARWMEREVEVGLVCFFRDLGAIRRLERELADQANILHQDKMMSLGRLAASVVHEINNPLSGILNYLRLMMRILNRGTPDAERLEKFKRYLELVETETGRCSHIISSLLTFSRKSPPTFGDINTRELLERCVTLSRHKMELSHIQLRFSAPADLPTVHGDFNQLQQAVINLIFNAIDAMPAGGVLHLAGDTDAAARNVIITVKDTGKGIAEEDLPHIFEPFYTTKNEGYGVGLGLSTVYGIIEHHHGQIKVESRKGNGTTFRIELPVRKPDQ